MGSLSLALAKEVNLASLSFVPSADEITESGRSFQSLMYCCSKENLSLVHKILPRISAV